MTKGPPGRAGTRAQWQDVHQAWGQPRAAEQAALQSARGARPGNVRSVTGRLAPAESDEIQASTSHVFVSFVFLPTHGCISKSITPRQIGG